MDFDEFIDLTRDEETDKLIRRYNVMFRNKTMIINKKIPVADFIRLREKIRKKEQIDNIIVDADFNYGGVLKVL